MSDVKNKKPYDDEEDVIDKFIVILNKLFEQLKFISSQLIKDGYPAAHPKIIDLTEKYVKDTYIKENKTGQLLMSFSREFHQSWDRIFERDLSWIESNFTKFIGGGNNVPSFCVEMVSGILGAKDKNGKSAIEPSKLTFLFRLLEGFCILSLKYLFWKMEPKLSITDASGITYIFDKELPGYEKLNINAELRLRNVGGLPKVIDNSSGKIKFS